MKKLTVAELRDALKDLEEDSVVLMLSGEDLIPVVGVNMAVDADTNKPEVWLSVKEEDNTSSFGVSLN